MQSSLLKTFFILTFKSIRHRPIRSWLTVLGIIIGIMLVVIILSLGDGVQNAILRTLQMFGSDLIIIFPGKDTNPLVGLLGGQKFKERDLLNLEKLNGVEYVVPMDNKVLNIEYKGQKKSTMIHAASWKTYSDLMESSMGIKLEKGRWPQDDQAEEVVLASKVSGDLFKQKVALDDFILIKSKKFKVVGILSEIGEQMLDNVIFVSMEGFRDLTGIRQGSASAIVKIKPDASMGLIVQEIKFQLSKQEVVRDFSVLTPDKAGRIIGNVLLIVELILVTIALISLIVGGVGVMNTMYTSVLERTRQIGVMKAIGASRDDILSLFLIESGIIGLTGGVLGIIFGVIAASLIGTLALQFGISNLFSFASLDFLGLFVILVITFIVGLIAGILPAKQASQMEPAEALRYE